MSAELTRILDEKLCAIIRASDETVAREALDAAVAGGFRFVEVTMNTPGATRIIGRLSNNSELLVGAGTVMTKDDVTAAADAGARVIVSPIADPEIIGFAKQRGCVAIPGTATPTEMVMAVRHGADLVKLFPAPSNLPDFLRSVLAPLPNLRIMPTAGVSESNFLEILAAGASAVGFVRGLFDPGDLARRDYAAIEARARRIHTLWMAHRAGA